VRVKIATDSEQIDEGGQSIKINDPCNTEIRFMNQKTILLVIVAMGLIVSPSACGGPTVSSEPAAPIAPIVIGDDLTSINLCQAIPQADIETVMRVKLVGPPTRYTLRNAEGTSGCYYQGPDDHDPTIRHYSYVILTPLKAYDNQPLFQNADVSGIGDGAYFNKSGYARELWVKVDNKVAFVVGFGDVANDAGAKAIAKLMLEAIQ
jgi:hypothetical protein